MLLSPILASRSLSAQHVQLWQLQAKADFLPAAIDLLQPAELQRMQRTRPGQAREEMVLSRAVLRVLLGAALGCAPAEVCIEAGPGGKPHCAGVAPSDVHFNVTHSHGRILIALCRGARVGVDIERMDANVDIFEVAEANFAPGEIRAIKSARTLDLAIQAFYRIWTAKEALLKAHGAGLLTALNDFDLSAAERGAETLQLLGPPDARERYFLRQLALEDGFAGALALSEPRMRAEVIRLQDAELRQILADGVADTPAAPIAR